MGDSINMIPKGQSFDEQPFRLDHFGFINTPPDTNMETCSSSDCSHSLKMIIWFIYNLIRCTISSDDSSELREEFGFGNRMKTVTLFLVSRLDVGCCWFFGWMSRRWTNCLFLFYTPQLLLLLVAVLEVVVVVVEVVVVVVVVKVVVVYQRLLSHRTSSSQSLLLHLTGPMTLNGNGNSSLPLSSLLLLLLHKCLPHEGAPSFQAAHDSVGSPTRRVTASWFVDANCNVGMRVVQVWPFVTGSPLAMARARLLAMLPSSHIHSKGSGHRAKQLFIIYREVGEWQ